MKYKLWSTMQISEILWSFRSPSMPVDSVAYTRSSGKKYVYITEMGLRCSMTLVATKNVSFRILQCFLLYGWILESHGSEVRPSKTLNFEIVVLLATKLRHWKIWVWNMAWWLWWTCFFWCWESQISNWLPALETELLGQVVRKWARKKKKLNETLVRKSTHQGAPKREVGWDPLTYSCPVGNGGSFMLVFWQWSMIDPLDSADTCLASLQGQALVATHPCPTFFPFSLMEGDSPKEHCKIVGGGWVWCLRCTIIVTWSLACPHLKQPNIDY